MKHVDVVVVGVGSMGSMALWQVATRGGSVLGIEQFGRVHAGGGYAGESRLFRVAAKEGLLFTPALLRAREMWQELGALSGRDILLETGVLSLLPSDHPDVENTLQSIRDYDLPHELFDAAGVRARYPQFHVEDGDIGILDTLAGGTRPETAVLAATAQALAHGAELWDHTAVTGIDPTPAGVHVRTTAGDVLARHVIVTAGPWTLHLVPQTDSLVTVGTFSLFWMMPRHIEWFAPDRFPGFMRDLGDVHAFGVPTLDGYSIKMSPHLLLPEVADTDDRPTTLTREQVRWAGEQAQRMIPDLVVDPVRWSMHPDTMTVDRMPIIDTLEDGRITIATGMSGNGFKFAPVYGAALADLATTGESSWQHEAFTVAAHLERQAERQLVS